MKKRRTALPIFLGTLIIVIAIFLTSVIKTRMYNETKHADTFAAEDLFTPREAVRKEVTVEAIPRSSTWGKIFDFDNVGLTENNYRAYTYDFVVKNNTGDEIKEYSFKLTFSKDVYLASAWNGSLEIHQNVRGGELVVTVPDLREFKSEDYALDTFSVDGEAFVAMKPGDYLIYYPSTSVKALEMPIKPYEGSTPGIILYVDMEENIEDSVLELDYTFHRKLTHETLFWISAVGAGIWLIALLVFGLTYAQVKYYRDRHERDNIIINESIETFIGFIDAKDPYTNGHSKRVAKYTKLIAKEFGYEGEELDRIYYTALLHDCGKIGVPDNILGKPGRLTDEEFEIIKSHTVHGGDILTTFKSLEDADEGARYHHERYDGKGYPEGKAGEDIPFIARMICVADSFDAMNTNRVYRNMLSKEQIISEIKNNKGKQFDPKVADVMLRLLKDNVIEIKR